MLTGFVLSACNTVLMGQAFFDHSRAVLLDSKLAQQTREATVNVLQGESLDGIRQRSYSLRQLKDQAQRKLRIGLEQSFHTPPPG